MREIDMTVRLAAATIAETTLPLSRRYIWIATTIARGTTKALVRLYIGAAQLISVLWSA
jgi:hypothetical protein